MNEAYSKGFELGLIKKNPSTSGGLCVGDIGSNASKIYLVLVVMVSESL